MSRTFLREGRWLMLRLLRVLGSRVVIAVCMLIAASVATGALRELWFGVRTTAVNGTVVRQDEVLAADWQLGETTSPGGPRMATAQRMFQAVIEFSVGGRTFEVLAKQRSTAHLYPLGSRQVVVFPPGAPSEARLRAELPGLWTQAGLLLMGTFVGAGTIKWWWSMARRRQRFRRRRRQPPPAHRA